eukprot:9386663-Alexandrium_andersonii.AAC.1
MAATRDVPARLLYGRRIAELYVLVVFEVYDLEESGLAWGIQRLAVWGWQPSVCELVKSSSYVRSCAASADHQVWVYLVAVLVCSVVGGRQ